MRYLYLVVFILLNLHCSSDQSASSYELSNNEVAWKIEGEVFKPSKINGSFILQKPKNRFSFTAMDGSQGVLVIINTTNVNLVGTYQIDKASGNSIKLNRKNGNGLSVFVSEACRPANGQIIITEHDQTNKMISGYFDVKLCPSLAATSIPLTIENGKFQEVKYHETRK